MGARGGGGGGAPVSTPRTSRALSSQRLHARLGARRGGCQRARQTAWQCTRWRRAARPSPGAHGGRSRGWGVWGAALLAVRGVPSAPACLVSRSGALENEGQAVQWRGMVEGGGVWGVWGCGGHPLSPPPPHGRAAPRQQAPPRGGLGVAAGKKKKKKTSVFRQQSPRPSAAEKQLLAGDTRECSGTSRAPRAIEQRHAARRAADRAAPQKRTGKGEKSATRPEEQSRRRRGPQPERAPSRRGTPARAQSAD